MIHQLPPKPRIQSLDYRNAKYYGQIQSTQQNKTLTNLTPNGFGMILDQNFTWIVGQFINGILSGSNMGKSCIAVFGDSDKMFGFNHQLYVDHFNHSSNHVTVYQSHGYAIYEKENIIVIDIRQYSQKHSNTLFKFTQITSQPYNIYSISFGLSSRNKQLSPNNVKNNQKTPFQLKYLTQKPYCNQKQFISTLSNMLQLPHLKLSTIDFQSYLRNSPIFQQYLKISPSLVNEPSSPTSPSTSYINTQRQNPSSQTSSLSITLKSLQNQISLTFSKQFSTKLSKISYNSSYHHSPSNQHQQISKIFQYYQNSNSKYLQGYIAEEIVNSQPQCAISYQYRYQNFNKYIADKQHAFIQSSINFLTMSQETLHDQNLQLYGRSDLQTHKKCVKNLQQYYKKSLDFQNKFINLSDIYNQRSKYKNIFKTILNQFSDQILKNNKQNISYQYLINKQNLHHQPSTSHTKLSNNAKNQKFIQHQIKHQVSLDDLRREKFRIQQLSRNLSQGRKRTLQLPKNPNPHQTHHYQEYHGNLPIQVSKWKDIQKVKTPPIQPPFNNSIQNISTININPNQQPYNLQNISITPYISINNTIQNPYIQYQIKSNPTNITTNNCHHFLNNSINLIQKINDHPINHNYEQIFNTTFLEKSNQLHCNKNKFNQELNKKGHKKKGNQNCGLNEQEKNKEYQMYQIEQIKEEVQRKRKKDQQQQCCQQQQQYQYQQQQSQYKPYRRRQQPKNPTDQKTPQPLPRDQNNPSQLFQLLHRQFTQISHPTKSHRQTCNSNNNKISQNIPKSKNKHQNHKYKTQIIIQNNDNQPQQLHHQQQLYQFYPQPLQLQALTTHYQHIKKSIKHTKKTARSTSTTKQHLSKQANISKQKKNKSINQGDKYHNNIHYYHFTPSKSNNTQSNHHKKHKKQLSNYSVFNQSNQQQIIKCHWPFTDYIHQQDKKISKITTHVYDNTKKKQQKNSKQPPIKFLK